MEAAEARLAQARTGVAEAQATVLATRSAPQQVSMAKSQASAAEARGSMGIATSATLLARYRQMYTNILGANVNPYNLQSRIWLDRLRSALMARGSDMATATDRSRALTFYFVQRQAAMLSFIDIFRLLGGIFVLLLPLISLTKAPGAGKSETSSTVH